MNLSDPKFYVVTADNFEDFKKRFMEENKDFVLYVLAPNGYKKLLQNQNEIQRYISQQKATIVYYESLL